MQDVEPEPLVQSLGTRVVDVDIQLDTGTRGCTGRLDGPAEERGTYAE
jgi:hypothetical protein